MMIWLTWRQFRTQVGAVFAGLAVIALALTITGPGLAHRYSSGLTACKASGVGCEQFSSQFFNDNRAVFTALTLLVIAVPALVGLFWGAPLIARELETGTHRLVWNQSVTRTRWLVVKLCLTGVAAMAAAGLTSLAAFWWSSPIDRAGVDQFPRLGSALFDARGVVPVGYAAFAFALGVVVGMLVRRTVFAMALTLVIFVVLQIVMAQFVRPHLITPVRSTVAITRDNVRSFTMRPPGGQVQLTVALTDKGWTLSNKTVDAAGHAVHSIPVSLTSGSCAAPPRITDDRPGPNSECFAEIARKGYRQQVTYQPFSRFWAFQWIETGIYAVLAAGLTGFSIWWVRRRLS